MTKRGLNIIHLYADSANEWNCSEWRAKIPSDSLNAEHEAGRTPHTARLLYMPSALNWNHPEVQKQLGMADVLVFQRNVMIPDVWDAMSYWRALGKIVLVDLDDHYPDLPASNPAHAYWIRNLNGMSPDPIEGLAEGLRHADALTSPSKVILEDWAHIVPGFWIPNWTRGKWYRDLAQKPIGAPDMEFFYQQGEGGLTQLMARFIEGTEGLITLGWGGSISHVDSWLYSGVIPCLDRIFEKFPQTRLKFCGHETRLDEIFARWGDKVIRQGGVQPQDWPQMVSTFDVGLAPLDTRPLDPPWRAGAPVASYDERRSWLKAAEYLCAGVPFVASQSRTYEDLARCGALVANTPDSWYAALEKKISFLVAEKQLAWERRRWAMKKLTFENNVDNYAATLERIGAVKGSRAGARLPGVTYVVPNAQPVGAAA